MDRLWAENDDSRTSGEPSLVVDVDGFEGPLDLLLHLARNQKVDLARISIVALVDQYLKFVEKVRAMRLELAADYLVMAAWLAYLKSKLLIPKQPGDDGESGEELAAVLQFRLKRLEAMRDAAARLVNRNRLGRDIFQRGMPEAGDPGKAQHLFGQPLRPADRLCLAAAAAGDHQCAHRQARRLVAQGGARDPDEAGRQLQGLDRAGQLPDRLSDDARKNGRRRSPAHSRRASKWCARAPSRSASRRRSSRSICAAGPRRRRLRRSPR